MAAFEVIIEGDNGGYRSCICHGDLNGNNIIIAKNEEVIFIDFQETGRGHVFEDFIVLEASIRTTFKRDVDERDWQSVLEWEEAIASDRDLKGIPAAYTLISRIRSLAKVNFPHEPMFTYYYGVAAFNCKLLRLPDLADWQKTRILAAILVSLQKLDELA